MSKALKKHCTERDLKLYDFIVSFVTLPKAKKDAFRDKFETQVLLSEIEVLKTQIKEQDKYIKLLKEQLKHK